MTKRSDAGGPTAVPDLSIAMQSANAHSVMTARIAGSLKDMRLPVSPHTQPPKDALRHMAKAINLALQGDFLETNLEPVYEAARVRNGTVEILHRDYIGLGDGVFAKVGKTLRSLALTFKGADPAAPENSGRPRGSGPITGLLDLFARKLNLVQEYEDMVPTFVEQTLDRLESVQMIVGWSRDEWDIDTTTIGLDVVMVPVLDRPAKVTTLKAASKKAKR